MGLNIVNTEETFSKAIAMHTAGRYQEAEQLYRQVMMIEPAHPGATQNLGVLAFQVGRNDMAVPLLKRAIELLPNNGALYCNLGDAYAALRQGDEAIACYEKAIVFDPNMSTAHNNLGIVYSRLGRVQDAIASWEKAIKLAQIPTAGTRVVVGVSGGGPLLEGDEGKLLAAAAYNNLGNAHLQQLELEQALECHRRACELNPNYANARSNMLRDMNHIPGIPPEKFLAEHRKWWEIHGSGIKQLTHNNVPDPDRKLRIGWVSADFREHSVTHFLLAIFENYDRSQFDFGCYSGVSNADAYTQRVANCTQLWRNSLGMLDEDFAKAVQADGIDILIDLSGHTSDHRLRVFAFKPAPVQISYLGYPLTTGASVIDYRISDSYADPEGVTDGHYSEKLLRMPHTMWCYTPPVNVPVDEIPPVVRDPSRPFTFASFNNCSKISPPTFALWSRILAAVPNSRMIVKASAMADKMTRERIIRGFTDNGIAADRIVTHPQQLSLAEHFNFYNNVDLALDTFPYNGTTTTCEALWMNVPVVTHTGNMHISRVGTSLLTNAGLPSLIGATDEEFVEIAVTLAKDTAALTAIRKGLRAKVQASRLMDAKGMAHDFGGVLRKAWQNWCAAKK